MRSVEEAFKAGVRWEQGNYGHGLVYEVRAHIRERKWKRTFLDMLVLLRYYPGGLVALLLLNERRLERRKLTRRLSVRKQDLEVLEQQLKESEGTQKPGGALEALQQEQRQEARWLRELIQRLERRIRNLDQQAQAGRNNKTQTLLRRIGRTRARV